MSILGNLGNLGNLGKNVLKTGFEKIGSGFEKIGDAYNDLDDNQQQLVQQLLTSKGGMGGGTSQSTFAPMSSNVDYGQFTQTSPYLQNYFNRGY